MGWETLSNGRLLEQAEANGFETLVTVDQGLRFQQNLVGRSISVCVLIADGITVEDLRPLIPFWNNRCVSLDQAKCMK